MTHEWKAVQVETRENGLAHVPIPGGGYVVLPPDVVHPLPAAALSAGDEAVLEAVERHVRRVNAPVYGEETYRAVHEAGVYRYNAARAALSAVRARAAAPAEGEKVAPAWPRPGWNKGLPPEAAQLIDAVLWWRGDCPDNTVALVNDAKPDRHMFASIAAYKAATGARAADLSSPAPDPSLHADGDDREAEAVDREDERERMVVAAREAVVEAAVKWRELWNAPPDNFPDSTRSLVDRVDALRTLQTPPAPIDPVAELREAAEAVKGHAIRASALLAKHGYDGSAKQLDDVLDRLRAALKARS